MKKVEGTEQQQTIPKTRQSLIDYIIHSIASEDSICIAFCHELNRASESELDYLCTSQCRVHREWHGHLLCLGFEDKELLAKP